MYVVGLLYLHYRLLSKGRTQVFENRMPRRILIPKKEEETEALRKLHFCSLFYNAFSVTRLQAYSVDERVISE
jgi:hypothetical protein